MYDKIILKVTESNLFPKTHQKIVWFHVSMDEVLAMYEFYATDLQEEIKSYPCLESKLFTN